MARVKVSGSKAKGNQVFIQVNEASRHRVIKALSKIKQGTRNRIIRKAMKPALAPLKMKARALAKGGKYSTGDLRKSIGSSTSTARGGFAGTTLSRSNSW